MCFAKLLLDVIDVFFAVRNVLEGTWASGSVAWRSTRTTGWCAEEDLDSVCGTCDLSQWPLSLTHPAAARNTPCSTKTRCVVSLWPTLLIVRQCCVKFYDVMMTLQIISAGSESCVRHWTINGEQKLQVPCTQTNVFNVQINDKAENNKVRCTLRTSFVLSSPHLHRVVTLHTFQRNFAGFSFQVLSIAGNSAKVDVCTNFGYKAFSLTVCWQFN